mmetsp:Transcript_35946/g.44636  ORF Transcript_35946/g.44636 Transcript_35946/m.44636 type:complete len:119 (+) Transcript_35946:414-770(+)
MEKRQRKKLSAPISCVQRILHDVALLEIIFSFADSIDWRNALAVCETWKLTAKSESKQIKRFHFITLRKVLATELENRCVVNLILLGFLILHIMNIIMARLFHLGSIHENKHNCEAII